MRSRSQTRAGGTLNTTLILPRDTEHTVAGATLPHTSDRIADSDPIGGSDDDSERLGLLWIGLEPARLRENCPSPGCTAVRPYDVICAAHDALLPFQDVEAERRRWSRRWFTANGLRILPPVAFLAAAQWDIAWPLLAFFAAVGLAFAALPLRGTSMTLWWIIGAWLLAVSGAYAASTVDLSENTRQTVTTAFAAVALVICLLYAAGVTLHVSRAHNEDDTRLSQGPVSAIAATLWSTPLLILLWSVLGSRHRRYFVDVPDGLRNWLLLSALGAVAGVLMILALASFIRSWRAIDLRVERKFHAPDTLTKARWEPPRPPSNRAARGALEQTVQAFVMVLYRFGVSAQKALVAVINLLREAVLVAQRGYANLRQRIHAAIVRSRRRCAETVRYFGLLLGAGIRTACTVLVLLNWKIVAPLGLLAAAAMLALYGAEAERVFLVHGGVSELLRLFAAASAGLMLLFLASWLLYGGDAGTDMPKGLRFVDAIKSYAAMMRFAITRGTIFFVAAAWPVGLSGTLWEGPIHVGYVTITSTVLLFAGWAFILQLQRREELRAASGGASAHIHAVEDVPADSRASVSPNPAHRFSAGCDGGE